MSTKVTCTVKTELVVDVEGNWDENQSLGTIRKEAGGAATTAIADAIKAGKKWCQEHSTTSPTDKVVGDIKFTGVPVVVLSVLSDK